MGVLTVGQGAPTGLEVSNRIFRFIKREKNEILRYKKKPIFRI